MSNRDDVSDGNAEVTSDASDDSDIIQLNSDSAKLLKVYQAGEITVVGFGGKDIPNEYSVAEYRHEILDLIRQHKCREFAFDLNGITFVPSGILGLIASIRNEGVEVSVYNPSPDVREVFEVTQLNRVVNVREVEL